MKKIILIAIIFVANYSFSQEKSLIIQTDLFDPMAKGASLWLNYDMNNHRTFVAAGFNTLPDFLNAKSDDFTEKRDWFVQLGYGYKLGEKKRWITGIKFIYKDLTAIAKNSNEEKDLKVLRISPIVFYEWPFYKNFTLTPWASYRIDVLNQKANFPLIQKEYSSAKGNFAMGLNIGYKFDFTK